MVMRNFSISTYGISNPNYKTLEILVNYILVTLHSKNVELKSIYKYIS